MLNDDIREILRSIPAVLVVEDGRPSYVITQYEAFRAMASGEQVRVHNGRPGNISPRSASGMSEPQESQVLERLNKEILSLREQIQMQEESLSAPGEED
jgi:hypothetical protein